MNRIFGSLMLRSGMAAMVLLVGAGLGLAQAKDPLKIAMIRLESEVPAQLIQDDAVLKEIKVTPEQKKQIIDLFAQQAKERESSRGFALGNGAISQRVTRVILKKEQAARLIQLALQKTGILKTFMPLRDYLSITVDQMRGFAEIYKPERRNPAPPTPAQEAKAQALLTPQQRVLWKGLCGVPFKFSKE